MRTPIITIFVVCVLIVCLVWAFYDYRKHGMHEQSIDISKSEADALRRARISATEQSYEGNHEKAIAYYEQALRYSPRDAFLHNDLGTEYYHLGLESMDTPMSEDELSLGTEVEARHLKGSEPLRRVKEALKGMRSGIITAVVDNESAKKEIETYVRSLGHYVHAEEEVAEDGSKDFWLSIITGKAKEAFLKSEKEYLQAIDIKSVRDDTNRKYSGYSIASRNLGTLYFRMGRKKDAVDQWRRALQLEPTDAELRELLGKYE